MSDHMRFGVIMFWCIVMVGITCLILWKTKIDPDGSTIWIYLIWVLAHVALAALIFEPWV